VELAGWDDDQASLDVAPEHQLFDEQARHDGLARTRIVRKKESQGLPSRVDTPTPFSASRLLNRNSARRVSKAASIPKKP
jgi:hypothetical protein